MKNSLYYIILLFIIIISGLRINYLPRKSCYDKNETSIVGIVHSYSIDGNKLTMEVYGKEKVLVKYYFLTEEEKISFNIHLGDEIYMKGQLLIPDKNRVFNIFNYQEYLLVNKINYIFEASKINISTKNSNIFYKFKQKIINHINTYESKKYLMAFILGDLSLVNNEIRKSYQINGISHLFAISGMHISIIMVILLLALKKINKYIKLIIIFLFLLLFFFLVNYIPSAMRAGIYFLLKEIFKEKNNRIKLHIITIEILLIINPYYILDVGFLFSSIITFFILFLGKNDKRKFFLLPLIAFVSGIPICINNYFQINILSIIYNIFFVPLVTLVIYPLSLITFICSYFDGIFLFFINLMEDISLLLSKISLGIIILRKIPFILIIVYYIIILIILKKIIERKYQYLLIFILFLFIHTNINYLISTPQITFIDVGQGDSTLIVLPFNKGNILVDTGGQYNYFKEKWKLPRNEYHLSDNTILYLKSLGITHLDYLILTHGDYDHMGESVNLVNNFKVENIVFNCGSYNDLEKDLINILDKKEIKYYSCIKELYVDEYKLHFLNNEIHNNENDNSIITYTELNGYKLLLMGDAGINIEENIIKKYNVKNINILKIGHHGSNTSSSKKFIDKTSPQYSVISVGKNNKYGHPKDDVVNVLSNSKIYRTDQDGSIMFKMKDKLIINSCLP